MVNVGVSVPLPAYLVDVGFMAKKAEELGFESFWCAEHPFIPVHSTSRFPGSADGVIPESYSHFVDPFVALARASGATKTIKLATGIVLVPERHPLLLAKEISTLDLFSGGRFLFGIGAGWNAEEMADHGTDFKSRFRVMRERVEAMKAIWTKSKPEYHGEFVEFPPMMTWPKPLQKPHPPVIVGGAFPHGARRAIAYGDGWMPHARRPAYGDVLGKLPEFRALAAAAGRDPATLPITVFGVAEDLDLIQRYRDAGVARVVFSLAPAKADEVLPVLDRCATLMRRAA
ncbi:MAG: LLM class F420-dependent oxidoreductase [Burkholderiales bacterium]